MEFQQFIGVFVVFIGFVLTINCASHKDVCEITVQKDLGVPSPVFLHKQRFLTPDAEGRVTLPRGDALTVACTGGRHSVLLGNITTKLQDLEAKCVSNKTFKVSTGGGGVWRGEFKEMRCSNAPWFSAEDAQECFGGSRLYKIGYKIQNMFHKVYEACFDHSRITTLYARHRLRSVSKHIQGGWRPQFIEGGLFGSVRMSELYKNKKQRARFNQLLGEGMDEKYFGKSQFLTRGHLAPRGDFPLGALQRASFHYVNTAPQWQRMNAGDWAAMEDALRRRVQKHNSSLTIYTGTYDVLNLEDKTGRNVDIYLAADENNNQIVPVPMYFYKLVYNPSQKTAVAFVTINSSAYNSSRTDELTFCCDVCDDNSNYAWLRWRNDGSHSFCCSYDEFVRKVDHFPKLDVQGLFF